MNATVAASFLNPDFQSLNCLHRVNFIYNVNFSTLPFPMLPREHQNISCLMMHAVYILFSSSIFKITSSRISSIFNFLHLINMFRSITPDSSDSDIFYVERLSGKHTPPRHTIQNVPDFTELSGVHVGDLIKISPVTSPKLNIETIESHTNELTIPYGYRRQDPMFHPVSTIWICGPTLSMSWLQWCLCNQQQVSTLRGIVHSHWCLRSWVQFWRHRWLWVQCKAGTHLQTSEQFAPMSPGESILSQVHPPRRCPQEDKSENWTWEYLFFKRGVSPHTCNACGQPLPAQKTPNCSEETQTNSVNIWLQLWQQTSLFLVFNPWIVYISSISFIHQFLNFIIFDATAESSNHFPPKNFLLFKKNFCTDF